MRNDFKLLDRQSAEDLQAYLLRAKRLDQNGLVRFRAFGRVLAAYVAPIFAGSLMDDGPTVLGLRTTELAEESEVDAVVPIANILDRLAKLLADSPKHYVLELPDSLKTPWAGISPPRTGWEPLVSIPEPELTALATAGIAEVAETLPEAVGGPIAARIRGEIWGRQMKFGSRIPTGAAFVAAGLGFLTENELVEVYQAQGWVRISSEHGHVLAKAATGPVLD
ncbi:unannotated protein [freshwater metagenome]|jgi:hypothetical protein|uniref:Unannotated protein n=1 Tax=freshwater metagenome TaxID=449393 RepID=A0A6J7KY70_9ZZZZ|nr:hypothetical protein [Actinomycetota bacterium]